MNERNGSLTYFARRGRFALGFTVRPKQEGVVVVKHGASKQETKL